MKDILWTDQCLMMGSLLNGIGDENIRQLSKWGIQTCSPFEWLAYLTEELGELSPAISEYIYRIYRNGNIKNIKGEAIQVAILALKIAEMSEQAEIRENI